jgi:hypothetical protein
MQLAARTTGGVNSFMLLSGGSGYTSSPTVSVNAATGSGATVVAVMGGTVVKDLQVISSGSGYSGVTLSFSGGGGTGAAATASVYTGSLRPMSLLKGRFNDVYGFDGMGRGIRWDGSATAAVPVGIAKPVRGPSLTYGTTANYYVSAIQVQTPGAGFNQTPTVQLIGGSYSRQAKALARVSIGRLQSVTLTDKGSGYVSAPLVVVSGGQGYGASLGIGILGSVDSVEITNRGGGYVAGDVIPVVFSSAQGLTNAVATITVDSDGGLGSVQILGNGTGATTEGVTGAITAITGSGGLVKVNMAYRVASVTAASSGTLYITQPVVSFRAASQDPLGFGAAATAYVNSTGNITGVAVYQGGQYSARPEALVYDTSARATATIRSNFRGVYNCAIRYIDDTPEGQNGPAPSSISELVELDVGDSASSITWTFNHGTIDSRVTAMELWRTSADQSVILYRIATIQRANFSTPYVDTVSDEDLIDVTRINYGLMPVTMPSGQLNARRFEVPPGNYSVAVMFQDRAWFAVDTTGEKPNSLMYSEIDEPESVAASNELVLQENTSEPDRIVALVPLATVLLIFQQYHCYRLAYVSQPVIDASLTLTCYRGILNSQCFATINGVVFVADSMGMYAFDGSREEPISVPVDNYWRDRIIDFSKSDLFHVSQDYSRRVVRFHYCRSTDTLPVRALCYCIATQAWWEEVYAEAATASVPVSMGGRREDLLATASGKFIKTTGVNDNGAAIPFQVRTGNLPLAAGSTPRTVEITFAPTTSDCSLTMNLHYNNSSTARPNAIRVERGGGFVADTNGAVLNLKKTRSALGEATGVAAAMFSGHRDPRSSGADRHVAIALDGSQSSDAVALYDMTVAGVQ